MEKIIECNGEILLFFFLMKFTRIPSKLKVIYFYMNLYKTHTTIAHLNYFHDKILLKKIKLYLLSLERKKIKNRAF